MNRRPPRCVYLALLAPGLIACGSSGSSSIVDAAPETAVEAPVEAAPEKIFDMPVERQVDAPMEAAPPADECDPVTQNCLGTDACDIECPSTAFLCFPDDGVKKEGEACDAPMVNCAKGLSCVDISATMAICMRFCRADTDCAAGKACNVAGPYCDTQAPRVKFCAL